MKQRTVKSTETQWPPRPADGTFPEIMRTLQLAQFLGYDVAGSTPANGRRMIRHLARECGLPTLGRVGREAMYAKRAVLEWIANNGKTEAEESATDAA